MAASSGTGRNVSHGISKGIGQVTQTRVHCGSSGICLQSVSKGIGKVTMNPMLQVHHGGRNMVNEIVVVVIRYTYEKPYANEINNELKISVKIVVVINNTGGKSRHFTGEDILYPAVAVFFCVVISFFNAS